MPVATITTDIRQLHLLHLCSANLPVGAYAYSQGLEYAVSCAWVTDEDSLHDWLALQLRQSLCSVDLALLARVMAASVSGDEQALVALNHLILACRESGELRTGDIAMGRALLRLLDSLGVAVCASPRDCSFVLAFGQAAAWWQVSVMEGLQGYAWSWLENQVIAATKLMPFGQTRAHVLLLRLQTLIPEACARACTLPDDDIGAALPAVAMASMLHETQYTRLFRS